MSRRVMLVAGAVAARSLLPQAAAASVPPGTTIESFRESPEYARFVIDNLWVLIASALVFVMHLGFATLESGLTRQKNSAPGAVLILGARRGKYAADGHIRAVLGHSMPPVEEALRIRTGETGDSAL